MAAKSEKAKQVNPAKMYPIDTGLTYAHSKRTEPDWSHLLETFVFLELRKRNYSIEYYKTQKGYEIDFTVCSPYATTKELIQVTVSIKDAQTKKREIRALEEGMAELQIPESLLITADEHDEVETASGRITILPALIWAIQLQNRYQETLNHTMKSLIYIR